MRIRRTANAGVLLELDGITVRRDGVCREQAPYLGTPDAERDVLYACPPDITAFTHGHFDHFDRSFAQSLYKKTLRPILGPEFLLREGLCTGKAQHGAVTVEPIPSRHLGKAGMDTPHVSFLIRGSKRILFTGDASPLILKDLEPVDVLIGPYPFATTPHGWKLAGEKAKAFVLVHMPDRSNDPYDLWSLVDATTQAPGPRLWKPGLGQTVTL